MVVLALFISCPKGGAGCTFCRTDPLQKSLQIRYKQRYKKLALSACLS